MNETISLLRQELALFREALDLSTNAIGLYESVRDEAGVVVDFRVVALNRQAEKMHGLRAGDTEGRLVSHIRPPARTDENWQRTMQVMETGQPVRETLFHTFPTSGRSGWFELTMQRWHDGLAITYHDLSELILTSRTLNERNDLFGRLLTNSVDGIVGLRAVRDASGQVVDLEYRFINPVALHDTFRHQPAEQHDVTGERITRYFPSMRQTSTWRSYLQALESQCPCRMEHHYDRDGYQVWYDLSITPLNDDLLISYTEITDSKRLAEQLENDAKQTQKELEAMNTELLRSNEHLQQFAYIASHDLQEPLRKIQSFGDILQANYGSALGLEGLGLLNRMQSSAARMQALVRDLLTYSRLTTQRRPFVPIDTTALVQSVLTDLDLHIRQNGATITTGSLPNVRGDWNQLTQLFQNLVHNAVKFHQPDVAPQVMISGGEAPTAQTPELAGMSHPLFARIDVQDNGIGFEEQYADRIFQIFQRLHGKLNYPGTGVGLAIARKIAELHGGVLTATSQPGQGARFSVFLPL